MWLNNLCFSPCYNNKKLLNREMCKRYNDKGIKKAVQEKNSAVLKNCSITKKQKKQKTKPQKKQKPEYLN